VLLTDRERQFLQLACSDDTYKQVAAKMGVSLRNIDGYRDSIYKKFNVEIRAGYCAGSRKAGVHYTVAMHQT